MNIALHKKLITESIRGWFVLDNVLFNGDPSKCLKENVLNKYYSIQIIVIGNNIHQHLILSSILKNI